MDVDVASAADELYGLDPAEFTAARAALARASEDKQVAKAIKALRRPSTSAWAVNVLARLRPDDLQGLARMGDALRQAQHGLDAGEMRAIGQQRHRVVAGLVAEARTLASAGSRPLSDAVAREVEDTLEAALADPDAAAAVCAGRLVRALSYSGFGEVDLDDAVAAAPPAPPPAATPPPPPEPPDHAELEAAEAALAEAVTGDEAARADLERSEAELAAATDRARDAAARSEVASAVRRDAEQVVADARRRQEVAG